MEISARQREILGRIVEWYAETAAPVGSMALAESFGVSPATMRAEMARLETFGLIAQPYTSAGRVPTDAGYRYYVNNLRDERLSVQNKIEREKHVLERRALSQAPKDAVIRAVVNSLTELTDNLGIGTIGEQIYLAGISRLFTQPEFMDVSKVQAVAELLDNLEPWLRETMPGGGLNVFIGRENPIGRNSDATLIISKFRSPYSDNSYVGVLGPTRQNYARVTELVSYAGKMLENILMGRS